MKTYACVKKSMFWFFGNDANCGFAFQHFLYCLAKKCIDFMSRLEFAAPVAKVWEI